MDHTEIFLHSSKKLQLKWYVEDFCGYFVFIDEYQSLTLLSEEFKINNCDDYTFFFKLNLFKKSISCSLYRHPKTKFTCISCRLWFKGGDKYWKNDHFIINYNEESSDALATLPFESENFLSSKEMKTLFPDNHLIVIGEFTMLNNSAIIQPIYTPKPFQSMNDHFRELLNSGNGSDVVLEVDGREFKAHKLVLSARSPVFAAMFDHDMTENRTNRVVIEDISEATFKLLLKFIYTDDFEIELDMEMGLSLLQAACKYQLNGLRSLCEKRLFKLITIENADKIRAVANTLDLTNFIGSVDTFMKSHPKPC